jgi:hypothetical protein
MGEAGAFLSCEGGEKRVRYRRFSETKTVPRIEPIRVRQHAHPFTLSEAAVLLW